ncbi:MAG: ketosynthase [Luteimonas sp.]
MNPPVIDPPGSHPPSISTPRPHLISPGHAAGLRLLLAIAYPLLAHLASDRHNGMLAVIALGDIALIVLLQPLLQRRGWSWGLLLVLAAALWVLLASGYALLPLLLVPVALLALVGYGFGRTLRGNRIPLITRMLCGLDGVQISELSPELRRYTRSLTAAWAALLGVMALVNLTLALLAVPDGLLASVGVASPLPVTRAQWSWCANVLNYGVVAGFFLAEFRYRQRKFPGRYHNLLDFLQRMARLGPAFWRDVSR